MTRLGDNSQVPKTDLRVEAFGTVDELNAVLGLAIQSGLGQDHAAALTLVQNDLFDLGADLCRPEGEKEGKGKYLRLTAAQVARLETQIDCLNRSLAPLRSFVLPGGSAGAAWLHIARTVCRRAERRAWELAGQETVNEQALMYLNRLSDLLFVMARTENQGGEGDVLWEPGRTQGKGV